MHVLADELETLVQDKSTSGDTYKDGLDVSVSPTRLKKIAVLTQHATVVTTTSGPCCRICTRVSASDFGLVLAKSSPESQVIISTAYTRVDEQLQRKTRQGKARQDAILEGAHRVQYILVFIVFDRQIFSGLVQW